MSQSIDPDQLQIVNNRGKARFEVRAQSRLVMPEYVDGFTHTKVPRGVEGQGIGSKLVSASLDFDGNESKLAIPLCP